MSNFRRPKNLTTRRMQETRPNPPKEHSTSPRPAHEIRWNCPVAAKCGGCQLTRLSYAEQLQWKQQRVAELLDGICEVRPILGMDDPFHYRNKVHAVLSVDKAGKPISGVYAMGTHRVVPVRHCLIEDRRADRIIQTIVAMLPAYKLRIYNEYTHRGFLRHILIRTGHVTGQIMVVLVATSLEFPGKKAFVQELIQRHPEITTVVLNCNQRETSMVLGTKEITLYGEGHMEDELCGKRFRISPQSFYQVNAKQCEVLYRTAIDAAHLTGAETLLDAYCGTGTIGLCASDGCKQLIGVELNADAIRDAKENARRNGVENARFLCDDAGRFMQKLAKEGNAPRRQRPEVPAKSADAETKAGCVRFLQPGDPRKGLARAGGRRVSGGMGNAGGYVSGDGTCGDGGSAFQGRNRLEKGACGVLDGEYGYVRVPEKRNVSADQGVCSGA